MAYSWGEIKINTIKKMFLNNVPVTIADLPLMELDRKYQVYLDSMSAVANEGLLRLMKVSRPIIKEFTINYNIPDTIYNSLSFEVHNVTDSDLVIEQIAGKSYYFEVDNECEIEIQIKNTDWEVLTTITNTVKEGYKYTTYKGLIDNPDNKNIRLVFKKQDYSYNVRNIAIYDVSFRDVSEVYNNTKKQIYDLKVLISDFYKINSIIFQDSTKLDERYNVDYNLYGDSELHVDSRFKGNLIIKYEAYPDKIDEDTSDDYIFTIADEMAVLLPLYMASELYKDDDLSLAVQYRNQFEVGLQKLSIFDEPKEFISKSGWL